MDEEMIDMMTKCHQLLDKMERKMYKLKEENMRLQMENKHLKEKYESASHLNGILLTSKRNNYDDL